MQYRRNALSAPLTRPDMSVWVHWSKLCPASVTCDATTSLRQPQYYCMTIRLYDCMTIWLYDYMTQVMMVMDHRTSTQLVQQRPVWPIRHRLLRPSSLSSLAFASSGRHLPCLTYHHTITTCKLRSVSHLATLSHGAIRSMFHVPHRFDSSVIVIHNSSGGIRSNNNKQLDQYLTFLNIRSRRADW